MLRTCHRHLNWLSLLKSLSAQVILTIINIVLSILWSFVWKMTLMMVLLSLWALIPEREMEAPAINPRVTLCFCRLPSFAAAYRVLLTGLSLCHLRYYGALIKTRYLHSYLRQHHKWPIASQILFHKWARVSSIEVCRVFPAVLLQGTVHTSGNSIVFQFPSAHS